MTESISKRDQAINLIKDKDLSKLNLSIPREQLIAILKMVTAFHYYWALSDYRHVPFVEHVGGPGHKTKWYVRFALAGFARQTLSYLSLAMHGRKICKLALEKY